MQTFTSVELHSIFKFVAVLLPPLAKGLVAVLWDVSTSQHLLPQTTLYPPLQSMVDLISTVKLVTL